MNIRKCLRGLAVPMVVQLYRQLRPQKTWEGVYNSFREIEVKGEGFDGDIWTNIVERETREITEGETIPSLLKGDSSLLPFLVVIISTMANFNNNIKILDFGGGAGVGYLYLKKAVPQIDNLEFHIVESDKVCQLGRLNFQKNPQVFFHSRLPEHISNFDIIHYE
ncbi:MAG: methyltransferase, TIGR04325 family [Desulfobaccales bacterium]